VEVVIVPTADDAARLVAGVVAGLVHGRPAVLGLATGSSPLGTYGRLIEEHRAGQVSFASCHAVLLDEYVGLPPDHPEAYRAVIRREFTDHVDLQPDRLHGPDVWAADLAAACARYDELLAELGGVDLQLLGIGVDGHLGFNEPGSSLRSRTRVKTLTTATRTDNARFFASADEVPRHVVTQGLGTISDARHVVLIATGGRKAAPVARAVEGPLTASCPASVIQLHPHATVVLDDEAARDLSHADYYREAYAGKPPWQGL
jgi:glucosamine-6-phosphate deaminase